jgi:hypothetical protein
LLTLIPSSESLLATAIRRRRKRGRRYACDGGSTGFSFRGLHWHSRVTSRLKYIVRSWGESACQCTMSSLLGERGPPPRTNLHGTRYARRRGLFMTPNVEGKRRTTAARPLRSQPNVARR